MNRLAGLLQEDTAGDPMGRHRLWTGKRLRQITAQLAQLEIQVCPNTVRRLFEQLGYGLHANAKSLSADCPERNEQFLYMAEEKKQFLKRGLPIISVDSKKKELIGPFKNPGRVWSQQATAVNDHDFRSQGIGMAIPSRSGFMIPCAMGARCLSGRRTTRHNSRPRTSPAGGEVQDRRNIRGRHTCSF